MQTLRPTKIAGQQLGEIYQPPQAAKPRSQQPDLRLKIQSGEFVSPSEAADNYFTTLIAGIDSAARIKSAQADLRRKISQQQKLLGRLETDLQSHADGEQHKKIGDLLLANLSTARRHKNRVRLIDYFEDARPLEIEIDESASLQEEAARRFELYARSKRAVTQIKSRIGLVRKEIAKLEDQLSQLASDPSSFAAAPVDKLQAQPKSSKQISPRIPGTRRYLSSDGFEILVGRTSQDNDFLTFKIARPNDLWLHTADYGGSHVVVRNPGKKEIAHRTLIEAAQLAAFFSQARQNGKADVHYTQRKFVSKPKGAKPGLVRLQRFKNITVEPKEAVERILS
jgi:predicted ribosome quality control (RQC) complex YloA/Tae2 family protein